MQNENKLKKISQPFSWIYNEILFDPNISMKAKGLWVYMNSKPDGWQFASERIAKETSDGISSIRAGLKELLEYGYLSAKKHSDGHFIYTLTRGKKPVNGKPVEKSVEKSVENSDPKSENLTLASDPKLENPTVGKSHCGKIAPINNKEGIIRKNNKKEGLKQNDDATSTDGTAVRCQPSADFKRRRPRRMDYETEQEFEQAFYNWNSTAIA